MLHPALVELLDELLYRDGRAIDVVTDMAVRIDTHCVGRNEVASITHPRVELT
jgi:hypothetical protein